MKIAGKIIYALWTAVIALVIMFYCFSCYMGFRVKEIVVSSVESYGENFASYDSVISENDYIKLWHEKPDNASYDSVQMKELGITQKYSLTNPYIMPFKDKNSFFSLKKIGYIYNIKRFDADGKEIQSVATENSKVVLDISYDGMDFKIDKVLYDNDFNEYNIGYLNGLALMIILIINAISRNIRYFDSCIKSKRKRNILRLLQPYVFPLLIAFSMIFDLLAYALIAGIAEELIFTAIFSVLKRKAKANL